MKLRIKGNSIRLRLSKKDVATLHDEGMVADRTSFGKNTLRYVLKQTDTATALTASFDNNDITVFIPASFVAGWPDNDIVGTDARMPLTGTDSLYILVEKDFVCLDETTEDQSDNYANPNKSC